jgi:hypothetical protein
MQDKAPESKEVVLMGIISYIFGNRDKTPTVQDNKKAFRDSFRAEIISKMMASGFTRKTGRKLVNMNYSVTELRLIERRRNE